MKNMKGVNAYLVAFSILFLFLLLVLFLVGFFEEPMHQQTGEFKKVIGVGNKTMFGCVEWYPALKQSCKKYKVVLDEHSGKDYKLFPSIFESISFRGFPVIKFMEYEGGAVQDINYSVDCFDIYFSRVDCRVAANVRINFFNLSGVLTLHDYYFTTKCVEFEEIAMPNVLECVQWKRVEK